MFTTVEGEILLDGQELTTAREPELEKLRGNKVAMIFQDPLTALSRTTRWAVRSPSRT